MDEFLSWLAANAAGPAFFGLPVTSGTAALVAAAKRWFRRLRRSDGLSRIVRAAAGDDVSLSTEEFHTIRRLLQRGDTWVKVGRGTVEDLVQLVARCLPERADDESVKAARAIAAGLLEFAVFDLEPEWFGQVLFARLARMETGQVSALDKAMLGVHADLAALFAVQNANDTNRFADLMDRLSLILDQFSPSAAGEAEVSVYLVALIRSLNTDSWPQDTRFGGPELTPTAIERKLRIKSSWSPRELDADELGRQCARLVVLGGPGTGKTWLARRTARLCAKAALQALAAGAVLDEVELPLYVTCARLAASLPGDSIRRAIASSALGSLPDLGGERVTTAVRVLFEGRSAPTLLVADSLDEAFGADERVRQADTLPGAWRVVLTSRPGSWNRQLAISDQDPSRLVGFLQPLRYPEDVESFIDRWFSGRPTWAADLAAQIRDRPALQQAATVPLILAFYCIVGDDQLLPARRAELYAKVIRRMLTGRWRGSGVRALDPDPDSCVETLRSWAWDAALSDTLSETGVWRDEFPTPRVRLSGDDRIALDHVAVPLGPADADTGMTPRRFVHRSVRDHLVAEHMRTMSAVQATAELIQHLWYDLDWQHAAPAALAMHPQRDHILKNLVCSVTGSDHFPADLAAIDGCWELRWFLARLAAESEESDWSPQGAEMIGRARQQLAVSRPGSISLGAASCWPTSNGLILQSVLKLLSDGRLPSNSQELADVIPSLAGRAEERAQAREVLLSLLTLDDGSITGIPVVAMTIVRLAVSAEERGRAREVLLNLLAGTADPGKGLLLGKAVAMLGLPSEDRVLARTALLSLLASETSVISAAGDFGETVAKLAPTIKERAQAREALIELLIRQTNPGPVINLADAAIRLGPTLQDKERARAALLRGLAAETDHRMCGELAEKLTSLDPDPKQLMQAHRALLRVLTTVSEPWKARELTLKLADLNPGPEELAHARKALLKLLTNATDDAWIYNLAALIAMLDPGPRDQERAREALLPLLPRQIEPEHAQDIANLIAQLNPSPQDQEQARERLLHHLYQLASGENLDASNRARHLIYALARLNPSPRDRAFARNALLSLLGQQTGPNPARDLVDALTCLFPSHQDQERIRKSLLHLLASETNLGTAGALANSVAWLAETDEEKAEARETLVNLLANATDGGDAVLFLADPLTRLDPAPADEVRAGEYLLRLLDRETDPWTVSYLAKAIAELEPPVEDKVRARAVTLRFLEREAHPGTANALADAVTRLKPDLPDQERTRTPLLSMLVRQTDPYAACYLANTLIHLYPPPEDQERARVALLRLYARDTSRLTRELADAVIQLRPTVADLISSDHWRNPPPTELMIAARRNSTLSEWLTALPQLSIRS